MEKNNLRFHEISWQKFHGIEIIIEIIKKQTNKQKMNALSLSPPCKLKLMYFL